MVICFLKRLFLTLRPNRRGGIVKSDRNMVEDDVVY
jgi:hypothetical protein